VASGHPRGAAVAARTRGRPKYLSLWALVPLSLALFCGDAHSGAEEPQEPETPEEQPRERWRVKEARIRFNYFNQEGFGYQSQAGPGPAGSERLWVYEPMFYLKVQQNQKVEHTVTVPIDVITSASTDAIDATTSASRYNEAGTIQINTKVDTTDDDTVDVVYGGHGEEWYASIFGGVGYTRDLAQDNATVSARIDGNFDWFNPYSPRPGGVVPEGNEWDFRGGISGNVEVSQILNPTTWVKAGYGVAWQKGELLTPWNSVPFLCDPSVTVCLGRVQERFPGTRLKQTVSGLLAHYLPRTSSTLRLSYRFFADDFDVRAHTLLGEVYQYMTERAYINAHYRVHHQTAVYFWTNNLGLPLDLSAPRTADSDLAQFWAHEFGVKVLFHLTPPGRKKQHDLDAYYNRYIRNNNLSVHVVSIGYAYKF
jgi:hypothetical protein